MDPVEERSHTVIRRAAYECQEGLDETQTDSHKANEGVGVVHQRLSQTLTRNIAQMEVASPVSDYLQLQQDEDEAGDGERPGQHHEVPVPYEPLVQVVTSPGGPGLLVIPLQSNNKNYTSWSLFI